MNIKGCFNKIIVFAAAAAFSAVIFLPFRAEASDVTEIYTYEDLLGIKDDPSGDYRLMCDIDLSGIDWKPLDFSGNFDGNGHAVLNCRVTQVTEEKRESCDGNMILYDTAFAGFFGITENAEIRNLSLLGIDVDIAAEGECFAGTIAGYTSGSIVENCTVKGRVSLSVTGKMFGVGGAIGYGNGEIRGCSIDTELVCIDEDRESKDEQFMGGINGDGYLSIDSCDIRIAGYVSDHGYVHNGGISGMFILDSWDLVYEGFITDNSVSGFIKFFEDNEDRRAYCEPYVGEILDTVSEMEGNSEEFERLEVFEYDENLLPHECSDPEYSKEITAPSESECGFTTYTCTECGYSYQSDYTSLNLYKEPETETEEITEPAVTEESETASEPLENEGTSVRKAVIVIICAIILICAAIFCLILIAGRRSRVRKRRAKVRKANRR